MGPCGVSMVISCGSWYPQSTHGCDVLVVDVGVAADVLLLLAGGVAVREPVVLLMDLDLVRGQVAGLLRSGLLCGVTGLPLDSVSACVSAVARGVQGRSTTGASCESACCSTGSPPT